MFIDVCVFDYIDRYMRVCVYEDTHTLIYIYIYIYIYIERERGECVKENNVLDLKLMLRRRFIYI